MWVGVACRSREMGERGSDGRLVVALGGGCCEGCQMLRRRLRWLGLLLVGGISQARQWKGAVAHAKYLIVSAP